MLSNLSVNRTAGNLRLPVPSGLRSGGRLPQTLGIEKLSDFRRFCKRSFKKNWKEYDALPTT